MHGIFYSFYSLYFMKAYLLQLYSCEEFWIIFPISWGEGEEEEGVGGRGHISGFLFSFEGVSMPDKSEPVSRKFNLFPVRI